MLTVHFDRAPQAPALYTQLYDAIRDMVISGDLAADEELPSKRALATHLDISVKTVENAYYQLMLEGYIYSRAKSGYYVARLEGFRKTSATRRYVSKFREDEYRLDIKANTNDLADFPFAVWSKIARDVLLEQDRKLLQTVPFNGVPELREAIARHLHEFRGMDVSPDQIVVGSGTEYLYGRIVNLLGDGCVIGMDDPGYGHIRKILANDKGACRGIPTDALGMDIDALRASDCTAVHVSPMHHFPLGVSMPVQRRVGLLQWVNEQTGRYIVEDDYNCEFLYHGHPVPSLYQIDVRGKVIYLNTFSKTVAPSVRVAYMVLPERLMDLYESSLSFYSCTVSSFLQYQLAHFIEEGHFERHIRRIRQHNLHQRQLVAETFETDASGPFQLLKSNAGTHFLLRLQTDTPDREVLERLHSQGIQASFVSQYCEHARPDLDHLLILNYSRVTEEGLDLLKSALLASMSSK